MSYNILRMHRRYLKTLDMDRLIEFLQQTLARDFAFEDDVVIERLREVMYELRSNRLASPGSAPAEEKPQKPFGLIPREQKPPEPQELGIRTSLSEKEREVSQHAIRRQVELENGLQDELDEVGRNGNVSFDPSGTSSPRTRKADGSASSLATSEAQERLDESVRLMLETADLNGGGNGESVMNTSANSASSRQLRNLDTSYDSQASTRSDVVRIRVPYNKEDAVAAKQKGTSPHYDGNKIRINVNHTEYSSQSLNRIQKSSEVGGGAAVSVYRHEKFEQNSSSRKRSSYHQGDGDLRHHQHHQHSFLETKKHLETNKYSPPNPSSNSDDVETF